MRFLHLTTFYPPHSFGGDAVYVYRLCHALADAGHEVDVVYCLDLERYVALSAHVRELWHPRESGSRRR